MSIKEIIAKRIAAEFVDGDVVNLGIGIPTLAAEYIPDDVDVYLHTENGLLGLGPIREGDEVDPDLVNAGKQPVGARLGSSFFSSADSFAMIRGGHVDVAVIGALQVDANGKIANWAVPGTTILGVGGAMDLVAGARRVIVAMTHTTKDGRSKLVLQCTYPVTGVRKADRIITELAVFDVKAEGLVLRELMPGVTLEDVKERTEAHFLVPAIDGVQLDR